MANPIALQNESGPAATYLTPGEKKIVDMADLIYQTTGSLLSTSIYTLLN